VNVFPSTAEEKLGFGTIRRRLDSLVLGALGRDELERLTPSSDLSVVRTGLERVREFQEAFAFDDPVPLNHLLDIREVLRRAQPEDAFVDPAVLIEVRLVLTTVRRLYSYFDDRKERYPHLDPVIQHLTPLPEIEEEIRRVIDEDQERVRDDASEKLQLIRRAIIRKQGQLRKALNEALRRAKERGYATEDRPTIRNGRMVIPVRVEAKRKVEGFVHDTSSTGQTVYIEPTSCLTLNNEVRELETEEQHEVERILRQTTALIRHHTSTIRENLHTLGRLDLLQAKARLAESIDGVVPDVSEDGLVRIREGYNPVLQMRMQETEPPGEDSDVPDELVPLDLDLGDEYRTIVVTGPNAGGKTVAMKTVGLFVLMLASGVPIPVDAEASRISIFDELFIDIGDEQSIEKDLSTFSSHLSNLRYMVKEAGEHALVLIDEAGTGTDPAEGSALAQAVLEHLTAVGARTIATTHHGTLKVYAHEAEGVANGSMEFDQATLRPTYRFQAGVPGSSYAMEVAARLGLPEDLLQRARQLVGDDKHSVEDLITSLEARTQELQAQLEEARKETRQHRQKRQEYEQKVEKLRREREEIRSEALEEAEHIVDEANARIERTIREIKEAEAGREATREIREELDDYRNSIAEKQGELTENVPERPAGDEAGEKSEGSGEPLEVGDQVILDEGSTEAEVAEIDDGQVVILMGNMRIETSRNRLRKVGGPKEQQSTVSHASRGKDEMPSLKAQKRIDLRGYRVREALSAVEQFLDNAMAANVQNVEILHGKGTGALRTAIQDFLREYPEVEDFKEASWQAGGAGVTVVDLQ
jgi:DNA mismatch repair protein MutS2